MNIPVPEGDSFFKNQSFITFTRSSFVESEDNPTRQHRNFVTAWLDGSQIYASDDRTNCALRNYTNGRLKASGKNN